MDPLAFIVAALAAGATAASADIAEDSIKTIYGGVKQWIQNCYQSVRIEELERNPRSEKRQGVLAEELEEAGAIQDKELMRRVQDLRNALSKSEAGRLAAEAIGIELRNLVVDNNVSIIDIESSGPGVRIVDTDIGGSLDIKGVKAGSEKESLSPNP